MVMREIRVYAVVKGYHAYKVKPKVGDVLECLNMHEYGFARPFKVVYLHLLFATNFAKHHELPAVSLHFPMLCLGL